jgi:hypothetical protein
MNVAVKIKVKFGLRRDPTDEQMSAWSRDVAVRIGRGEDAEVAARNAAFANFEGVEQCFYGSECG